MPSHSNPSYTLKLLDTVQISLPSGKKDVVVIGLGSAKKSKFVEIIGHAGFSQDGEHDETARRESKGESIGASRAVHVVCRLSTSSAGHIFGQKVWLPRDMFLEIR
jgi:hypothetical protein